MCQSRVTQLLLLMMEFKVLGLQLQKGFSSLDTTTTYPASCIISTRNAVNAWKSRSLLSSSHWSVNVDNFSWNKYIISWLYFRTMTIYIYLFIYLYIYLSIYLFIDLFVFYTILCISWFNIVKLYVQWVDPNLSNFLAPTLGVWLQLLWENPINDSTDPLLSRRVASICSYLQWSFSVLILATRGVAEFSGIFRCQMVRASSRLHAGCGGLK